MPIYWLRSMAPFITKPVMHTVVDRRLRASLELLADTSASTPEQVDAWWQASELPTNMGGGHGKVAVIDTEGGFRPEKIHPIAERFGVKVKHFLCCGLFDLCHLIFLSPFS